MSEGVGLDHQEDREAAVVYCPVDRWRVLSGPTYMCPDCRDHLAADLTEVGVRYLRLDARPGAEGGEHRGRPGFASRTPGRDDVWVARDERSLPYKIADDDDAESERPVRSVARTLSSWAALIAETRDEHPPLLGVVDLVGWLRYRVEYIARWPDDGPELALDIRALRNQLRSLTGEPNPKPAAYCIRFEGAAGDERECRAAIFLPVGETDVASMTALWCTGEVRHRYSGGDLLRLKLANDEEDAR